MMFHGLWRHPGVYSLFGLDGAGKTTLLSIVSGVMNFDKGEVRVRGLPPSDPIARSVIGYCPREPGLIDNISGYDNALFYGRLYGLTTNEIISKTRNCADGALSREPTALSLSPSNILAWFTVTLTDTRQGAIAGTLRPRETTRSSKYAVLPGGRLGLLRRVVKL